MIGIGRKRWRKTVSQVCVSLGLGLAFAASLLLNYLGGDVPSPPLWQKAAYFLAGGIGMVLVSRVLAARSQQAARAMVPKQTNTTSR
jgi:hypothetical protein